MNKLAALVLLCFLGGCSNPDDRYEVLRKDQITSGLYRYETCEAVCYAGLLVGLQCFMKPKPNLCAEGAN